MAQITPHKKKDGTLSYTIRVYSGRTREDKVITRCKTVTPPPGIGSTLLYKIVRELVASDMIHEAKPRRCGPPAPGGG